MITVEDLPEYLSFIKRGLTNVFIKEHRQTTTIR